MTSTPKKLVGATIAAAVALTFSTLPVTSAFAAETVQVTETTQVKCEGMDKSITMEPSEKDCLAKGGHLIVESTTTTTTPQ